MGDKPYIDYYYWEYLIKNHENLWNHSFKKMPLTRRLLLSIKIPQKWD